MECSFAELRRQQRRLTAFKSSAVKSPKVWCSLAHSFPSPYSIKLNLRKRQSVRYWLLLTNGSQPMAYAQRTLNFPNKSAAHDYLAFVPSAQSNGYGAQILANALSVYSHMGISKITLTAGLSAGSAVWPRLGFAPESEDEWRRLCKRITSNVTKLNPSVHQAYQSIYGRPLVDAIDAVVGDKDPQAIFDLVDIDPGNRAAKLTGLMHGIAGCLLSGGHWRGSLEMNGTGYKRLLTYLDTKNISWPVISV